ncbi:response regulator [Streptomyces sp. 147326]
MRILVVEDEEGLAESLRRGLSADGHLVEVAHDGHRGLDLALALAGGPYDVVLLDLMLPGLSGYEICARMRAHGDTTPVLMLTARDGEYDEAEGLDCGADDYLTKPFSFVVLAARIRAPARRAGAWTGGFRTRAGPTRSRSSPGPSTTPSTGWSAPTTGSGNSPRTPPTSWRRCGTSWASRSITSPS